MALCCNVMSKVANILHLRFFLCRSCHVPVIPHHRKDKLNQPPTSSPSLISPSYPCIHPHHFSFPPPCVFLSSNFNLYLLSSPFVSSKPSHNLPGLCSSLSSFLFLYFKPAVKSFGKARFSSLLLLFFFRPELSSFSLPAVLCILHPPP